MEHIMQFAVNIDDEKIVDTIMASGVKQIEKDIQQAIMNKLFETPWGRRNATPEDALSGYSRHILENFLEFNKDAIIDSAGKHLAEKLARTKAAKELVNQCKNIDQLAANIPLGAIIATAAEVK